MDITNPAYYGFTDPTAQASIDAVSQGYDFSNNNGATQPVSNSSGGQSGLQTVLTTLSSLFTGGIAAYNTVAQNTGLPLANGTPTNPTVVAANTAAANAAKPVFLGLNQSQLLMVASGVAVIAVLLILKRR